jgi:quercetin dioxygenase-like cupin family protein
MFRSNLNRQHVFRIVLLISLAGMIVLGLGSATRFSSAQSKAPAANHPANFSHALPQLDGAHLRATVVEVSYAPGEADKPHSHPCNVIGYVAEGAIRFQVKGGAAEAVYKAGESFYEPPNGVHQISANASDKEPAKLIAFFVCDHDTPLTVPPINGDAGHESK